MRYDDILHETFITSVNGILANPANQDVKASFVVDTAWQVAVLAAAKAKNSSSTLSAMVFTSVAATSAPADPILSTGVSDGSVNRPNKSNASTLNPTNVLRPDGGYVPPRT